jgi:hypothetical protein
VHVELQPGETCNINNLRMIFKGPNKDEDIHCYQVDMDFETTGNIKCMQEFLPNETMFCIVMLKSGFLKMAGCTLSLE